MGNHCRDPFITCLIACATLLFAGTAWGAPIAFDYTAHIDGSDRAGAPQGTLLTGRFSYDPERVRTVGSMDYFPEFGSAYLLAEGEAGFRLERETRVIVVTPGGPADTMTMQSFLSEEPNGWNMVFDFIEPVTTGWLDGNSSLPSEFPMNPDNGFISLYFTDEGDWTRVVDATILTVKPADVNVVPLPAAAWLFGSAILGLGVVKRRKA